MTQTVLDNPRLQERVHVTDLASGLRVFVMPKPGFHRKYAVFSTRYGSIDSRFTVPGEAAPIEVPDGIAHFLEHTLFQKDGWNAQDRFAELGASANAYTSYTMTSYLFSTTDRFEESLDLLLDYVQEPYFSEENVEKERGIIEQELRMYEDMPDRRVVLRLMEALYHKHPVRLDIGGTVESIRRITPEMLQKCYDTFYHPQNMAVFVVGDVEPEKVAEQVARDVEARGYAKRDEIERFFPDEPAEPLQRRVADRHTASRPRYAIGLKDVEGLDSKESVRRELLTRILLRVVLGRSSALYNELYDQGLIDDTFSAYHGASSAYGYTLIGGETPDPEALDERLRRGLSEAAQRGVGREDFERAKRHMMGRFLRSFNSLEYIANSFLSHYFRGSLLFDYIEAVDGLSWDEAQARLKEHFNLERAAVSVLYPSESD